MIDERTIEQKPVPLETRMRAYEAVETRRRLDAGLPIYARVDGRGFSRFTKGMVKPFDDGLASVMVETACLLVEETAARVAFVQSDEISLVFDRPGLQSQVIFGGRTQKTASLLAGLTTAIFTERFAALGKAYATFLARRPHFDARAVNLPDREETANMLIWRQQDAIRNAVSAHATATFGTSLPMGRSTADRRRMLNEAGAPHDAIPVAWREGVFVRREVYELDVDPLSRDENIVRRPDDTAFVLRSRTARTVGMRLADLANREEFVFERAAPIVQDASTPSPR